MLPLTSTSPPLVEYGTTIEHDAQLTIGQSCRLVLKWDAQRYSVPATCRSISADRRYATFTITLGDALTFGGLLLR